MELIHAEMGKGYMLRFIKAYTLQEKHPREKTLMSVFFNISSEMSAFEKGFLDAYEKR